MNRLSAFTHVFIPYIAESHLRIYLQEGDGPSAERTYKIILCRKACYYSAIFACAAFKAVPHLGDSSILGRVISSGFALIAIAAGNQMVENYQQIRNAQKIILRELTQENAS